MSTLDRLKSVLLGINLLIPLLGVVVTLTAYVWGLQNQLSDLELVVKQQLVEEMEFKISEVKELQTLVKGEDEKIEKLFTEIRNIDIPKAGLNDIQLRIDRVSQKLSSIEDNPDSLGIDSPSENQIMAVVDQECTVIAGGGLRSAKLETGRCEIRFDRVFLSVPHIQLTAGDIPSEKTSEKNWDNLASFHEVYAGGFILDTWDIHELKKRQRSSVSITVTELEIPVTGVD